MCVPFIMNITLQKIFLFECGIENQFLCRYFGTHQYFKLRIEMNKQLTKFNQTFVVII